MEYILTTDALKKQYGHFTALGGVSMHIPKGAIYGFVGENGAGKTTLIRVICGLQSPSSGGYTLFGREHTRRDIAKSRRRMGAVVESSSLYLDMTAQDNLRQQYRLLGMPSFGGIPEILRLVGLEEAGRKKVKNFSLGMRQRLGIAVALAGNPDFMVLDEPVNGLDPQGIIEIRELVLKLNREHQITFLISSHILDELSRLATHYGFIHKGRILREISSAKLEAACRKCLCLTASHIEALCTVLDAKGLEYRCLPDSRVEIYGVLDITDLVGALAEKGCKISAIHEREEGLENYYMNLMGGRENA